MRDWKLPVFATLAYVLAGSGWIVAGHFLSSTLYPSEAASLFELAKGLAYVGITATILFIALTYLDHRNTSGMAIADLGAVFEQSLHRGNLVVRWLPVFVAAL